MLLVHETYFGLKFCTMGASGEKEDGGSAIHFNEFGIKFNIKTILNIQKQNNTSVSFTKYF